MYQLNQLVKNPTRGSNILDLLLTNLPDNSETHVLEELSDRNVVHCVLPALIPDKSTTTKTILNYSRADCGKMNTSMLQEFRLTFEDSYLTRTINENWLLFRDKLKEIECACTPKLTIKTSDNAPWFTKEVKRCLNRKKRVYRRAKQTNTDRDWGKL